ncbi:hypothetical protein Z950_363 [Sulfitobacter mediterraneus KCTC 32188]|nr:hypothetical protein Z950_363 [Sulfitobacter mediterraneus KCTC 32188]
MCLSFKADVRSLRSIGGNGLKANLDLSIYRGAASLLGLT